ncbi:hypothetical protein D3C79_954820 [compost metagenome]
MTQAGRPATRNRICQPLRPNKPSRCCMMPPANGPPIIPEIGIAAMNIAVTLARRLRGTQSVRNNNTPGKKPASATPSAKRRM